MTRISAYDYVLLFVGTASGAIMLLLTASLLSPARALTLGVLLALAVAALLRDKSGGAPSLRSPDPWLFGFLLLALFFRANIGTNYMGGQDPGGYVNFSGIMQHFGGLYFPDTFRATLPNALQQIYDDAPKGIYAAMPKLAQMLPPTDGLWSQTTWYPLHPGWMAVFAGLFGADMHGLAMLAFSLLGVTGAYFLTFELTEDRVAARLAALLVALNPALCFMAKFPLTEAQTAALLLNAGYLLAKGLKVGGRNQLLLLSSSFVLVIAYFFTRLSFPILAAPGAVLYILSCSQRLDSRTAQRLRVYLWLFIPAGLVVVMFYYTMMPMAFRQAVSQVYVPLIRAHKVLAAAAVVGLAAVAALGVERFRNRLQPIIEFSISFVERAAAWLPLLIVLASIPSVLKIVETGQLFYVGKVTPEPTGFRYHVLYRWILAITPFLWVVLLAAPWLVKRQPALTIPLLFLGGTLLLTEIWAPSLPYLYYHMRYLASEIIPFSLIIVSVVLAAMWRTGGWRRYAGVIALGLALPAMTVFSALQLRGQEGQDPHFFREIDAAVAGDDVLIVDEQIAWLALPIRYYFGKQVFVIPDDATPAQVQQVVVYLLANSGTKYGRILELAETPAFPVALTRTVERELTFTETVISNSEHWRLGRYQSHDPAHLLLPTKWHSQTALFTLSRVNAVPPADHGLSSGCPIDFSASGNSIFYLGSGWSDQEDAFRWTAAPLATLHVRLAPPPNATATAPAYLDFQATPFGAAQRLIVSIDGHQVSELELKAAQRDYEIEVHLDNPDADVEREISFRLPDAHSPKSVGVSADGRQLGMAMRSLKFLDAAKTPGDCKR